MKNLLLSSFLLLLLSGCKLGHYGRLQVTQENKKYTTFPKPIFGDNFNSFLFKANISIYGKDVSGLLVAKQMEPHDYRVIFTTELGLKLFDFEFKDTAFTLHYCVPQFNRPKLLNTIKEDIEILLMSNLFLKPYHDLVDKQNLFDIQEYRFGKYYNYYFTEKASRNLVKIEHCKKRIKKVDFLLNNYKDSFPNNIIIKHYNIKLKIELNLY